MLRSKSSKSKTEETTAEAGPMMAFDKRLQQREKPKKAGGFGKPKAEAAATHEETAPAGTFFKPKKVEKKSSFRR